MKKIIYTLITAFMLGTSFSASADVTGTKPKELTEQQAAKLSEIQQRVEEIKSMDKSDLTKEERKQLRNELKDLKNQARAVSGGGVYLSVGAIIIIILLLILLL